MSDRHVQWKPITHEAYIAIYKALGGGSLSGMLRVHATASFEDYWLTVWGLDGSDAPILKSLRIGTREDGEWSYSIAAVDLDAYLREHADDLEAG